MANVGGNERVKTYLRGLRELSTTVFLSGVGVKRDEHKAERHVGRDRESRKQLAFPRLLHSSRQKLN